MMHHSDPVVSGSPFIGDMHIGRSWNTHELEDDCPCPKAPCGLVAGYVDECEQHSPAYCKTMRQGHAADRCPAVAVAVCGHRCCLGSPDENNPLHDHFLRPRDCPRCNA